VDPRDRSARALFGDGAGAVVLRAGEAGEPGAIGPFVLGSDGRGADLIMVPAGGSRLPHRGQDGDGSQRYFTMQGQAVYRQAVETMASVSQRALDLANWPAETLDWLVCHQANQRILLAVAARLGLPAERCFSNIALVGNTAAASIPLALAHGGQSGAFRPGDRMLLTAFGGGLTWGSAALRWPDVDCGS
jgi:3-oxoacyl-[acyl-carrier-protein] synthase-3